MELRTVLGVTAHDRPFVLIVEPWAEEFPISIGDRCEVVALHPAVTPTFEVEIGQGGSLVVWVKESGATYEFWRAGEREFHTPVAIP
jgi:hypothetical protein